LVIKRDSECTNNVGGNSELYIFEYHKYARSEIKVTDNILINFPASVIFNLNSLNIGYTESVDEEDGGVVYSQSGNFDLIRVLPTDSYKNFAAKDWRIILKDNNGNYRLVGLDTGIKLKFTKDIGSNLSDFNGFKFSFETKEENTAPFLTDLTGFYINDYPLLSDGNDNIIQDGQTNDIEIIL
tara:strand:+ start:1371 stop:1919 length:549 start_codon:yes stop_codon:yes gene_type:complete